MTKDTSPELSQEQLIGAIGDLISGAIDGLSEQIDTRFDRIDARLDAHDTRFDAVDARFDAMDARFDAMDARFDKLEQQVDDVQSEQRRIRRILENLENRVAGIDSDIKEIYDRIVALENSRPPLTPKQLVQMQHDLETLMAWARQVSAQYGIPLPL